ncbi:Zn-ribbon domain-containing OB-fold protein [Rhodococcus sp. ARC_M6]|uniref:Zn-ribbon domain-containing OB-fold protein n=1 Tax=Rhodococcus sp. ARC_M6 TaxID=2928852 RepID=UPI001FB5457E|nr:OB-fold domain-containing protein [Rhodococcus sp. ARC_M6]MCJ0905437.1 OB-fold domain-containing protein [Rhodococcus sp. ARC_M6]
MTESEDPNPSEDTGPSKDTSADVRKPIPRPDENSAGYWTAAREHRLAIQYCAPCELLIHTPAGICPQCDNDDLDYRDVSGRGKLYSYTVIHDAPAPAFANMLPYIVGVIELEEQDRLFMIANILDTPTESVKIGIPMEVTFESLTPDCELPQFRPAHFNTTGD